jgi:hypothetical protein
VSNQLSNNLIAQLFAQESDDPFLMLFTFTHPTFVGPIRFVNNKSDIVSRGDNYVAFPVRVVLPPEDGESERTVSIEFDNVSQELTDELRSITTPIDVKIELVLASAPDDIEITLDELKLQAIQYNSKRVTGTLVMDGFLNIGLTSETYTPTNYPGLF